MSQTIHPLEALNLAKRATRRRVVALFLKDGTIDSDERAILDQMAAEDEALVEYRARQVAAQSFERNGDTRLTRDRFQAAGHKLVDLATERTRRGKVIAFPHEQQA